MTLTAQIHCKLVAVEQVDGDLEKTTSSFNERLPTVLANGTGASQVDKKVSDTRTLTASASETLDLNAIISSSGPTINFAKVKSIRIGAADSNTNNVVVGNAATFPFLGPLGGTAPTLTIPPGGSIMLNAPVNGWASTNGVSDKLLIANSAGGTSVDYDIEIIGTSA